MVYYNEIAHKILCKIHRWFYLVDFIINFLIICNKTIINEYKPVVIYESAALTNSNK